MGDLEDSVFKQNIPGKYSTWNRGQNEYEHAESDEEKSVDDNMSNISDKGLDSLDSELLNEARYMEQAEVPESIRRSILAERERKASTGVKGVLADYKSAVAMASAQQNADANQRVAILTRITEGYKEKNTVQTNTIVDAIHTAIDTIRDSFSDDDDDGDDDAFMREFRDKRLKEMRNVTTLPSFGFIRDISSADFISEVDETDRRVFVVVHLYEASIQSCTRLNRMLEEIAAEMPLVKFLRMQASSNMIAVDLVTLPIMTIYRGGESVKVLAGIAHELGDYFTKEDIEWLLINALNEENGIEATKH